jgi:hypothetical protein
MPIIIVSVVLLYFSVTMFSPQVSCTSLRVSQYSLYLLFAYPFSPVSTYPSDPQARVGLMKCMEVLKTMEIVWPSAGRALELLRGSKVNTDAPSLPSRLSQLPDRQKRPADSFNSDDVSEERGHLPNPRTSYVPARSNPYPPSNYPAQANYLDSLDLNQAASSPSALPFYSSHERWPSNNYNAAPFPGPLSTSALPQLYSTGLVDDQTSDMRYRGQQTVADQTSGAGRYPQFWNDLTTFPQLGSTYGAVSSQSDQGAMTHPPPLYIPDQYNLYSEYP